MNNIPGIEEVNMIKDDGTVIHFNNPKVSEHQLDYEQLKSLYLILETSFKLNNEWNIAVSGSGKPCG